MNGFDKRLISAFPSSRRPATYEGHRPAKQVGHASVAVPGGPRPEPFLVAIHREKVNEKMPGLIGRKIGMTQIFDEDGAAVGVTVLEVGPCPVVQIKTAETDGYDAVQLGFGRRKDRAVRKPQAGHSARAGLDYVPEVLAEFDNDASGLEPGQELTVEMFEVGGLVKVTGPTKGRGFQGTVKRHGFGGGRGSHGGTSIMRAPGSIGAGTDPSRVIKGKRMPGRMGGKTRTAMNRKIVRIDAEKNLLMIRGSVPGARNNIVLVRSA